MKYKVITMALIVSATCLGGAQLGSVHTTKVNNSGTSNKVVTTTKPVSNNENKSVNNANDTNKNIVNDANKNNDSSKGENVNKTTANKTTNSVNNSTNANDATQFMAQVEQAIYKQVNEQRVKAGLSPLSYSDTMQKYARMKSEDMAKNNYFDHKDKSGKLMSDKMKAAGVQYSAWGENIAYISGISDPTELANMFMKNWMNSPGHRANILSPNFKSIGVGVYKSGNKVYATQEFYK